MHHFKFRLLPKPAAYRYCLVVIVCMSLSKISPAQDYKLAIGARFSYGWGLSIKGVLGKMVRKQGSHTIDGMIRYGYHGVVFTQPGINFAALYEKHFPFGRYQNWAIYLGGGPSMGVGKSGSQKIFTLGLGPVFGIEVTAPRLPVNFALDYKPTYYFDKYISRKENKNTFSYYELGFSVRYALQYIN